MRAFSDQETTLAKTHNDVAAIVQRRELVDPDQGAARKYGWQRRVYLGPALHQAMLPTPGNRGVPTVLQAALEAVEVAGHPGGVPSSWAPVAFTLDEVEVVATPLSTGRGVPPAGDVFWVVAMASEAQPYYAPAWARV